jgi:hypothetical protein
MHSVFVSQSVDCERITFSELKNFFKSLIIQLQLSVIVCTYMLKGITYEVPYVKLSG